MVPSQTNPTPSLRLSDEISSSSKSASATTGLELQLKPLIVDVRLNNVEGMTAKTSILIMDDVTNELEV